METLLVETIDVEGGQVLRVTLNRPEVRNAINKQMIDELRELFDGIDDTIRVIILRGAGDKAFAAGADIAELKGRSVLDALARINSALFRKLEELTVPTIAAINGYALGGGCELAMACDIRIASENAKLGQPEVGLGIIAGAGAVQRLPRLIGMGRAKELLFTGRLVDAAEAERIGLVNKVVSPESLDAYAMDMAEQIAKQAPLAVSVSKLAVNAAFGTTTPFDTLDALGQAMLFESKDKHDRMQSFLDRKRVKK